MTQLSVGIVHPAPGFPLFGSHHPGPNIPTLPTLLHYRTHNWIDLRTERGVARSMSKKERSPDNSACEGFFERIKKSLGWMSPTEYRRSLGLAT